MLKSGGGSLVFTGTFLGHTASFPGVAAYAACKAGLDGLVQTLAVEFGSQVIRANVLVSDMSAFQTGSAMLVDGGVSINRT
jgi:NAD(P)-dependent dehydrogenase (short-subunit alcohol dehydrogenase family)